MQKYENDKYVLNYSHEIISFNELEPYSIEFKFNFSKINEKIPNHSLLEYNTQTLTNVIHLDYSLLTDFFNYAHTYALIIHPAALVLRIQQKTLSPGLLLAIYALTYLFIPNQNKELANFYFEKAYQYLFAHLHTTDIQNVHISFLLSNFGK